MGRGGPLNCSRSAHIYCGRPSACGVRPSAAGLRLGKHVFLARPSAALRRPSAAQACGLRPPAGRPLPLPRPPARLPHRRTGSNRAPEGEGNVKSEQRFAEVRTQRERKNTLKILLLCYLL